MGERTDSEKYKFTQYGPGYSTGLHTLLRSGACGLEGLTGTESPAAEGMYITGAVWVGLDTAEDCCKSSLSAGSAGDKAQEHPQSSATATEHKTFRNNNTQIFLREKIPHKHLLKNVEVRRNLIWLVCLSNIPHIFTVITYTLCCSLDH